VLYGRDLVQGFVERGRELLMHPRRLVAGDGQRPPAVADEEREELVLRDPREDGRVRDLVAVQVEDGKDGAVTRRVKELVGVPARGERAGLGLAVSDDARDEEVRVVEGRAERVRERVPELAALVDRAGCLGSRVARDPARERELAEELPEPVLVARHVRVELAVGALEIRVRDDPRAAVAGARDVDRIQVAGADRAVQVRIDEVQPRRRAEVAQQSRLDVLPLQGLAQERVVEQVDLPHRQVVRRPPVRVQEPQLLRPERTARRGNRRRARGLLRPRHSFPLVADRSVDGPSRAERPGGSCGPTPRTRLVPGGFRSHASAGRAGA
jgi:hypothetical protein